MERWRFTFAFALGECSGGKSSSFQPELCVLSSSPSALGRRTEQDSPQRFLCCYFLSLRPLRPKLLRASDEEEGEKEGILTVSLIALAHQPLPFLFFDGSLAGRSN